VILHDIVLLGAMSRVRIRVMSGPLQRLIGPAKARLLRYLKEAALLLTVSVKEKTIEEQEITIEDLTKRINTNICLLE